MKKILVLAPAVAICLLVSSHEILANQSLKNEIIKTMESKKAEAYSYPPLSELILLTHHKKTQNTIQ